MLRYLRTTGKHTKLIWWVLTIVTVVTFVFGFNFLFGVGGSGSRQSGVEGTVNGGAISSEDYQNALNKQREAFRQQYGSDPTDRDEKNVEAQAWRGLVSERLMADEARAAGLRAHDSEVVLALRTSPPPELANLSAFQTDGKFDPNKYRAALSDPNNTFWAVYEDLVRKQMPVRKLQERLLSSLKLSEPELRESYRDRFERISATVVMVPPDMQSKVAPPQAADLDRVYEEYKGRFYSDPRLDLEVLTIPRKYSEEDVRAARQFAQNLVQRARQGEDFAQLAKDYSEGPGAAQGGVVDRVIRIDELGPDLGEHLDALQPGQISDAYNAGSRFIIMKVLGRVPQPGQQAAGFRLAQIIVRVKAGDTASQEQYTELQKLRARAVALKSLGKAAAEKGMATTRTGYFDFASLPQVLSGTPEVADWGFGAKLQAVSPIFEGQDAFVVAQLAELHAGGAVARKQLEGSLRQMAEIEARVAAAKPAADRVAQALAQGQSLEAAAKTAGLTAFTVTDVTRLQTDQRLAMAPEVLGQLFVAAPGRVIGPVRQPSGWFFARLDQRIEAPMDSTYEKTRQPLMNQILSSRQQTFFGGWLSDLRTKGNVRDQRVSMAR